MKFKKLLTFIFIFSLFLTGCSSNEKESDAMKFKNEYESLNGTTREKDGKTIRTITIDEDNPMVYATDQEIVDKMNNGDTFIVYFGFSDCPWCRSIVPTLIQVAKDLELTEVYYCDIKNVRDEMKLDENNQPVQSKTGSDAYPELLSLLDSVLEDYTLTDDNGNEISTNEKRIFAPNIIAVIDGSPVALTSGNSDLQTNGYMELTDEMLEDSYNKIYAVLEQVANAKSACAAETKC